MRLKIADSGACSERPARIADCSIAWNFDSFPQTIRIANATNGIEIGNQSPSDAAFVVGTEALVRLVCAPIAGPRPSRLMDRAG